MQDEDGGVWHKQTSEQFAGFIMPEKDKLVSYVDRHRPGAVQELVRHRAISRR